MPALPAPAPQPNPPAVIPAPAVPGPQLRELLTHDQRRQAEADFGASLRRARASLARAAGKNLTPVQRDTTERIRVFIGQAEAEKVRDISTALQLARRADLLGQDLVGSLPQ